jgi:hypothetical protein
LIAIKGDVQQLQNLKPHLVLDGCSTSSLFGYSRAKPSTSAGMRHSFLHLLINVKLRVIAIMEILNYSYKEMGPEEMIDMTCVQCLIGRVWSGGK